MTGTGCPKRTSCPAAGVNQAGVKPNYMPAITNLELNNLHAYFPLSAYRGAQLCLDRGT
jgi:hypothetical protein